MLLRNAQSKIYFHLSLKFPELIILRYKTYEYF